MSLEVRLGEGKTPLAGGSSLPVSQGDKGWGLRHLSVKQNVYKWAMAWAGAVAEQ